MATLAEAGYLERVEGRIAPTRKFFARPLLGSLRAGQPQPATQEEPEVLTVDDYLIDDPNRSAFVKVRGDSMKDAGVVDGDLVVVETNAATKPGDIVVAVVVPLRLCADCAVVARLAHPPSVRFTRLVIGGL
jgi:repressor LexA